MKLDKLNSQLKQCQYELEINRAKKKELEETEKHLKLKIRELSEPQNSIQLLEKITVYLVKQSLYKNAQDITIDIRHLCNAVNPKKDDDVKVILEKLTEAGVLKKAYEVYCDDNYVVLEVLDNKEIDEPYLVDCCYCDEGEHEIYKRDLRETYKLNLVGG